jgi:hypothetical protein
MPIDGVEGKVVGTWQEVCAIARKFGAQQLNDTAWLFQLQVAEEGRLQKVFVFYEFMRPDFEFMQIKSVFGPIQEVDLKKVIKGLGQLQVGAIGYSPLRANDGSEIDGMLNTSIYQSPRLVALPIRRLALQGLSPGHGQ